ncbi:hypothetical protein, partial [Campylobacter showae]|uniref:hypothetical protein n=1 Tax=Campylobacter showae TaxID=204 RepID=UPI00054EDA19
LHKNANLKNVRRDSAIAPLERAVGLERAWERVCLRQLRVRSTTQRKATLYFALLVAASRP